MAVKQTATQNNLTALLQAVVAVFPGAAAVVGIDGSVVAVNTPFLTLFALPSSLPNVLVPGQYLMDLLQKQLRDPIAFTTRLSEIVAMGEQVCDEAIHLADGRTLMRDYVPLMWENKSHGALLVWREMCTDTDAHQRPPTGQLLTAAMEYSVDAFEITNIKGQYEYVNQSWEQLTGYTRAEAMGRTSSELLGTHDPIDATNNNMMKTLDSGSVWQGELISRKKCGDPILQEVSIAPVFNTDGEIDGYTAVKRDIGTRKRQEQRDLEQRFSAADKLAGIGQLAAGVAHEINNPLSYIIANLDFIESRLKGIFKARGEELEDLSEVLLETRSGAERVRQVVRDLKSFSRNEKSADVHPFDVRDILASSIRLLRNEIHHRARLVRVFEDVPLVLASPGCLGQVFVNLLVNAVQAIPEGNSTHDAITIHTHVDDEGMVVIEISDTGHGIPAANLERIFEPFFTTKSIGQGTGLGLSVSHNLVTAMNGILTATSLEGQGTTFTIRLPPAVAVHTGNQLSSSQGPQARAARILIIDDDTLVAGSLCRALRDYEVMVIENGTEAERVLCVDEAEFDLILCDVMMPDVTGVDLYERACRQRPQLARCFVFMTGGAFTPRARKFIESTACPCVYKPFEIHTIIKLLNERLAPAVSEQHSQP